MNRYAAAFLVALILVFGASRASANGFESWAAIVVAGDFRAHSGAPSEVFDNGRRDITKALVNLGFVPSHIKQFSVRPEAGHGNQLRSAPTSRRSTPSSASSRGRASGGCFLYFTSHGAPQGILIGNNLVRSATSSRRW